MSFLLTSYKKTTIKKEEKSRPVGIENEFSKNFSTCANKRDGVTSFRQLLHSLLICLLKAGNSNIVNYTLTHKTAEKEWRNGHSC